MAEQPLFVLRDVSLCRGGNTLLDRVSMEVPAGSCTALVGKSGSGKSTLLRLLTRLADPDSGEVWFRGSALPEWDVLDLRKRVQLVGQSPVLLTDTVTEEVQVGVGSLHQDRVLSLLARVGLDQRIAHRSTSGLSGGEAQRLCLARALVLAPDVLLLDEPAAALDRESANAIEEAVRAFVRHELTVLLVTHDAGQVRRLAERATVLEAGAVTERGAPAELTYLASEA